MLLGLVLFFVPIHTIVLLFLSHPTFLFISFLIRPTDQRTNVLRSGARIIMDVMRVFPVNNAILLRPIHYNIPNLAHPYSQNSKLCFWPHPENNYIAISCDASYQPSHKSGGFGIIIRDSFGHVIMSKANRHQEVHPPRMHETVVLRLEMTAILEGLRLARKLHFPYVEVQSDSKNAISIMVGETQCPQKCLDVLCKIEKEIHHFRDIAFQHIYRESNQAADFLSKCLSYNGERCMDYNELDQNLKRIVMEDACGRLAVRSR